MLGIIYVLAGVIIFLFALDTYFCRPRHPQEPRCIRPKIPIIGHGIGLARYGSKYFEMVNQGQPEIFTLPIFTFRIYVINSRHLFPIIMRHSKTLSFLPFMKVASKLWCDASDHFMAMHEEGTPWMRDFMKDHRSALQPGQGLDYQNMMTGKSLHRQIDVLCEEMQAKGPRKGLELYAWIQHILSLATSDGVYGKNNPLKDPQAEKDFWTWNASLKKLFAKVPRFLMAKDIQARDRLFKAFAHYFETDWSDAAAITKARKRVNDREGVSAEDQASGQASFNIALLGNSIPTGFWVLYDIISRPALLHEIRAELETHAIKRLGDKIVLDVAAIRSRCPLLLSSYQETQRTKSKHANIREALVDTIVESPITSKQYFLTKGAFIQMPSGPIHKDSNIWGPTVNNFDAHRFASENAVTRKGEVALMPWGSAPHMCPARQFASTEIMLFAAMMVLRFDYAQSGRESGTWQTPITDDSAVATLAPPKNPVLVDMELRDGWQSEWELEFGQSSVKVPLASG